MSLSWWDLPGPRRFVEAIARDARDGMNIAVCLPHHTPDGLSVAVRRELGDGWTWQHVDVDPRHRLPPVAQLYAQCVSPHHGNPAAIRNAGSLVREPSFAGRLVWLTGIDELGPPQRSEWTEFLTEYAHACRASELADRPLVCAVLVGAVATKPPAADTCLAHRHWDGHVEPLDMTLFAADLLRDRPLPPLHRRVATATIAHIAIWDPGTAERLADGGVRSLLKPAAELRAVALERGWEPWNGSHAVSADLDPDGWSDGIVQKVEGRPMIHSAALVGTDFGDPTGELERRLWCAEVGVVLPYVEERRRAIIERFGRAFKLPHYPGDGRREPIVNASDLEIGHIYHQLEYLHVDLGDETRRLVRHLKDVRDRLAHLQPLRPESLLEDEIVPAGLGW
ncbi:MAG TPA: hypothetical protein VH482_04030 [Thermomicrobiales bacterium]